MKRALQVVLIGLSLIPLYFGITGIILGAAQHLPPEAITPSMDNQYRYLSAFYLSLAGLLWWMIPHIEIRTTPFRILVIAIFIGGLARALSYVTIGAPTPMETTGMILELGAPVLWLWQAKIKTG